MLLHNFFMFFMIFFENFEKNFLVIKKSSTFVRKIINMRFINVFIYVAVIFLGGYNAYSQSLILNLPPTIILSENFVSLEDDETVCIDSLVNLSASGVFDASLIPATHLYNYVWNNQLVNPYGIRVVEMPDTMVIDFTQFCPPNMNVVTSEFGYRRGWQFHYGIDTRLKTGDPICSSFDGMVRIVQRGRSYGNYIVIRHFNGLETVYGHLSKHLVKVNQIVRAGEIIGLGGNTGRSTGPHLHYEIRYLGQPISPRDLIDFENHTAIYRLVDLNAEHFAYVKELEEVRFYTVRRGDTLSGISSRLGVSIDRICQLNNIRRNSILRVGQRLRYT